MLVGPFWLVSSVLTALAWGSGSALKGPIFPLLINIVLPVFVLSIVLGIVTANLAAIESGEPVGFRAAWTRLGVRRKSLAVVALIPTLVTIVLAVPTPTRLLLLLLFNGVVGPPLLNQIVALEVASPQASWARAKELLRGRAARTLLYLVNIVVGTGLVGILVGGGIAFATIGSDLLELVALPVQALVLGAILGFVAAVEYSLFRHLVAQEEPSPG